MSGPTRGELDRMASAARRLRRFFNSGSDDLDAVMRMEELFRSYPLPPEDDRLRDALAIASSWVRGEDCALNSLTVEEAIAECCRAAALHQSTLALPPEDGARAELANRALRHATAIQVAHGPTARVLRECAAGLLRQPEVEARRCLVTGNPCGTDTWTTGAPCRCENCRNWVVGVSKEAVLALIQGEIGRGTFRLPRDGEALMAKIEALPEAAPALTFASLRAANLARLPADRLESDAQAIEEAGEILSEVSIGLAWAAGEAEPPRLCSDDCRLPHLGPRARRAITDGLRAAQGDSWNPPRREGS